MSTTTDHIAVPELMERLAKCIDWNRGVPQTDYIRGKIDGLLLVALIVDEITGPPQTEKLF